MILRRVIAHFRKQEWTAIFLDFVIVVAGILIAFQITAWNETRKDRRREREYLARIAAELDETIPDIEHAIRRAKERSAYGEFLIRAVADPSLVRAEPARFLEAALRAGYTLSPSIRSQTFDEIKSAGDLNILTDRKLRFDLMEFYSNVNGDLQWNYSRELKQNEYTIRVAGVLTLDELVRISSADYDVEFAASEEEAVAAYNRMLDRPALIEWLPTMADRTDDLYTYGKWMKDARDLRASLGEIPGVGAPTAKEDIAP